MAENLVHTMPPLRPSGMGLNPLPCLPAAPAKPITERLAMMPVVLFGGCRLYTLASLRPRGERT